MTIRREIAVTVLLAALLGRLDAAEYFVSTQGCDTNDGLSRATAFATVQKGVDALAPGDTLTLAPGEYFGSVRRDGLGGPGAVTTIRADLPGTAVLRGDVPVGGFRKGEGRRFTYVADLTHTGAVVVVNELDTLGILARAPNLAELDFKPGVFFHDAAAGKLYIAPPDTLSPTGHVYTASLIGTHGLYLSKARRVVIEGLVVTGFNADHEMPNGEFTLGSVWGIFVADGKECVIRDCHAWLNGQGIGINSQAPTSGDNVIERCTAWANATSFGMGDRGGLTAVDPRRDTIRDSTAFLNGHYGINLRGAAVASNLAETCSRLQNNLAWGNGLADFKIKGGSVHVTERCAGGRPSNALNPVHCLFWRLFKGAGADNIQLAGESNVNVAAEFADPENHDYRLQSTSRFRKSAPDGSDRGPFPYKADIFYVGEGGNDEADGLSVATAWQSLARATRGLKAGDTLYLLPGTYQGGFALGARGEAGKPVTLRGRGTGKVVIRGGLLLDGSRHLAFERVDFEGAVGVKGGEAFSFRHCRFDGGAVSLRADEVQGLRVEHCAFRNFQTAALATGPGVETRPEPAAVKSGSLQELRDRTLSLFAGKPPAPAQVLSSGLFLQGNWFENRGGPALRLQDRGELLYAGYNGYADGSAVWSVGESRLSLDDSRKQGEMYSSMTVGAPVVARGPLGRPLGPYSDRATPNVMRLVEAPGVHSLSATTANIEWMTSLPATCELAWGTTPDCTNTTLELEVMHFGTYSLTGLQPGRTYYFRLRSLSIPPAILRNFTEDDAADQGPVAVEHAPVSFTTPAADAAPVTYTVAPDGDDAASGLSRKQAWRTLQHAAGKVRVGDTVLLAAGRYPEQVRLRVTGAEGKPVTFKCLPGEKVILDGAGKSLNQAFVAAGKHHLRFDGIYFTDFNREPLQDGPTPGYSAEFNLYRCRDIAITRCFSEGRGGYSARFMVAWFVDDLLVQNCVTMNKMSGAFWMIKCLNTRLSHSVIARPLISAIEFHNDPSFMVPYPKSTKALFLTRNIFTDMLEKKARLNIALISGSLDLMEFRDNCFLLRSFPPSQRAIFDKTPLPQFEAKYGATQSVYADPSFAGDPSPTNTAGFAPDRLMDPTLKLDFDSFFATNPEMAKRGIGLQPEAFKEFHFNHNQGSK
jgi:hypothetical protein